jgi:hypothetical protein
MAVKLKPFVGIDPPAVDFLRCLKQGDGDGKFIFPFKNLSAEAGAAFALGELALMHHQIALVLRKDTGRHHLSATQVEVEITWPEALFVVDPLHTLACIEPVQHQVRKIIIQLTDVDRTGLR